MSSSHKFTDLGPGDPQTWGQRTPDSDNCECGDFGCMQCNPKYAERYNIGKHDPKARLELLWDLLDRVRDLEEDQLRMRKVLVKLRDCDWVITPHDRMDAVRNLARVGLGEK